MRPPPLHRQHVEHPSNSPRPSGPLRRAYAKCTHCSASASALLKAGKLIWSEIPHRADGSHLHHRGCGGRLVAYDITNSRA